jgi:hypothetical protein
VKRKNLVLLLSLLLFYFLPLESIISQANQYDTSGWIDGYEPVIKASFKRPPQWKKTDVGDGKSIYFSPDQSTIDDQGRAIRPMIGISNVEEPEDVESYRKSIDAGGWEQLSTKDYDYYIAIVNWKNIQRMYIYIEVEKGKRYIGCSLIPYSTHPSSKTFEAQLRAMVESFEFEQSTRNEIDRKKADDKIQLRGHWKVD